MDWFPFLERLTQTVVFLWNNFHFIEDLHYPQDFFYDCADVRSGANAPYAFRSPFLLLNDFSSSPFAGLVNMLSWSTCITYLYKNWVEYLITWFCLHRKKASRFWRRLGFKLKYHQERLLKSSLNGPLQAQKISSTLGRWFWRVRVEWAVCPLLQFPYFS